MIIYIYGMSIISVLALTDTTNLIKWTRNPYYQNDLFIMPITYFLQFLIQLS